MKMTKNVQRIIYKFYIILFHETSWNAMWNGKCDKCTCSWPSGFILVGDGSILCRLFPSFLKVCPHYAAQQNATHCSFVMRQKLFGIYRQFDRIHILLAIFQVTKTVGWETRVFSVFSLYLCTKILKPLTHHMPHQKSRLQYSCSKYRHGKPLMRPILCRSNFHASCA